MEVPVARELIRTQLYSEELGIALDQGSDAEYFKWFLASLLFGGHIGESVAKNTYRAFERHRLLTPRAILRAGLDYLINPIMREGGYVRYDGRKSTQVLRDCQKLLDDYDGSLRALHAKAHDPADLEALLCEFYGVGPVTVDIFLRELAPYWKKADPPPLPEMARLARDLGIRLEGYPVHTFERARIEAGLVRMLHRSRPKGAARERARVEIEHIPAKRVAAAARGGRRGAPRAGTPARGAKAVTRRTHARARTLPH
jgi:hypothetical protein